MQKKATESGLKGVKPKAQFTLQVDSLKIPEIN
jgi:hypothetical protein